ncbi:hypothetical protein [Candidatus Tisiphia endosymbiont of Oplodontha viridula]|uniref:hypothetical protein n=1 Tax=Candidatus Tisiphia endosymbiont of Oplodontha viridula TaxID=3077925 RepID=UPI0035C8E86D
MKNAYIHQITKEIDNDKRASEEIYQAIINRLKIIGKDKKLTNQETHAAARNLIGFCQEIINYKIKKQRDKKIP